MRSLGTIWESGYLNVITYNIVPNSGNSWRESSPGKPWSWGGDSGGSISTVLRKMRLKEKGYIPIN